MSDHAPDFMRARHHKFVNAQACRLGVKPSAILQSVRDFGLTAADIAELADKSGLTRYPRGEGKAISFKVIETRPVMRTINTGQVAKRRAQKMAAGRVIPRREPQARQRRDRLPTSRHEGVRERMAKWRGDGSMADAIRKVGLRK